MDVGEVLTGGRVSCHDGFIHVAAACSPVISFPFGCARFCARLCRKVLVTCRVGTGRSVDG